MAAEETLYIASAQRKREGPCLSTRRVRQLCGPLRLGRRRGPRKSNFLIAPLWPMRTGVYETTPSPHSIMSGIRAQPLSIESLLQKQKQEKEAASKVCPACGNRRSSRYSCLLRLIATVLDEGAARAACHRETCSRDQRATRTGAQATARSRGAGERSGGGQTEGEGTRPSLEIQLWC